jgi:hypothetical protein
MAGGIEMSEKVLGWVCPKMKLSRKIKVSYVSSAYYDNGMRLIKSVVNGKEKEELYDFEMLEEFIEFLDCKGNIYAEAYKSSELMVCEDEDGDIYFDTMNDFSKDELSKLLKDINKKLGTKYKWQE